MYKTLSPDAVGIRGKSLHEAIELARVSGFTGLAFDIHSVARMADEHGIAFVREQFARAGVRPAHWNLPVAWRADDRWEADLRELPALATLGHELGYARTATFMPSGSDDRPYAENFAWHVERFRPIARVLADAGCRLGIEFIGPKTYRAQFRHEFIHTLPALLELIQAIGMGNVGLLLDSWHLYTSGGSIDDLDAITADDVVVVHVNDAPAGVARDDQIDTMRTLPMETGVIDLPGFLRKLSNLGYQGPVMPEPFSRRLDELAMTDPAGAVRKAGRAMDVLWLAAGLA